MYWKVTKQVLMMHVMPFLPSMAWRVCCHGNRPDSAPPICAQTLFLLMLWLCLQDAQESILLICIFLLSLISSVNMIFHK